MLEWILKYWVEWAFGVVAVALAAGYKSLSKQVKRKKDEDDAVKEGVLAMLHDRIYQSCRYYINQGWVDIDGMKNIEYLYKSYHALGGNGTGTELFNRVCKLPIKEN